MELVNQTDEAAASLVDNKQIEGREPDGTFAKGHSGNPAGRPSRASLILKQRNLEEAVRGYLTTDKVHRLLDAVMEKALKGDPKAAKLIMDKLIPDAEEVQEENRDAKTVYRFEIVNSTIGVAKPEKVVEKPEVNQQESEK